MMNNLFDRTCSIELINQSNPYILESLSNLSLQFAEHKYTFPRFTSEIYLDFSIYLHSKNWIFSITYNCKNNRNISSELYNCKTIINIHKKIKIRLKLYVAKLIELKQFKVEIYLQVLYL